MDKSNPEFVVWDDGRILRGDARHVLEQIRKASGKQNEEAKKMTVQQYADALIEDAPYFMDKGLHQVIAETEFPSVFERALTLLASSPSSRVRIVRHIQKMAS